MGLFDKLFGKKSEGVTIHQPEPSPFTEEELSTLAREIDTAYERIFNSHKGVENLKFLPCFPKFALLNSSDIVELCRKSKRDANEYIISLLDRGGQFLFHRQQCRYVLSLWAYQQIGANISDNVIEFVQEAAGKEPDDCEYLIKLEHLW